VEGCPNPSACYYRHCLPALSPQEISALQRRHKIAGKVQRTLSVKGHSVRRVHILINRVLWFAVHFIIEDDRLQHLHHQKYCAIYRFADAVLVTEFIANVVNRSPSPGKYLSFLKNLIDGDTEPGSEQKEAAAAPEPLVHFRDILAAIGQRFDEIPRPLNPHLVQNLSRVPWVDFKTEPLPVEAYDFPDIYLNPGDLVRVWRPKKFVYHAAIYLGDQRLIHISNGIDDGVGGKWGGIFQSGSAPSAHPLHSAEGGNGPSNGKYYDYGRKLRADALAQKMRDLQESQLLEALGPGDDGGDCGFERIEKADAVEEYGDDDDMDLEGDSEDEEEQKRSELAMTHRASGEEKDDGANSDSNPRRADLLSQGMAEGDGVRRALSAEEMEAARRARECGWTEFVANSRKKDLELGFFVFPWRRPEDIVYTAKFLTEIHYMKGQYSVFKNNCEHFALYCCTGLRYSPQANAIEKITTPVMGMASNAIEAIERISGFAGSLLSKVAALRNSPKLSGNAQSAEENENRRNHPVLREGPLDDGGDDELERMLVDDGGAAVLVMANEPQRSGKREAASKLFGKLKRGKKDAVDLESAAVADRGGPERNGADCPVADEYANDEEDVLAQSVLMTPGGLSASEILCAQKQQDRKWNV